MKKITLILLLSTVAFVSVTMVLASVSVTITVPDQYTQQVLDAMNTISGKRITLEVNSSDYDARWDFMIMPKDPNETNLQFAQRFTKELVRASVKVVKAHDENERYRNDISAIKPPDVNVPDEIVE